jgi:hypothetical protein
MNEKGKGTAERNFQADGIILNAIGKIGIT